MQKRTENEEIRFRVVFCRLNFFVLLLFYRSDNYKMKLKVGHHEFILNVPNYSLDLEQDEHHSLLGRNRS